MQKGTKKAWKCQNVTRIKLPEYNLGIITQYHANILVKHSL
jgi:hypothetical protein